LPASDRPARAVQANAWSAASKAAIASSARDLAGRLRSGQFTRSICRLRRAGDRRSNLFALAYDSKGVTDTPQDSAGATDNHRRAERHLTLRAAPPGRNDFNPDRAIAATFQTLPGASFVVNGAAQASDSAMSPARPNEVVNGWSIAGTFEGEFSNVTESYAGKGVGAFAGKRLTGPARFPSNSLSFPLRLSQCATIIE